MSTEGTPDAQIGEALLNRVVHDQMIDVNKDGQICFPSLPEVQPLINVQEQKLVDQLGKTVQMLGDRLNKEYTLHHLIDSLARVGKRDSFSNLVKNVFSDGQINWGRIVVLFYAVGKLAVKMVLSNLPSVFSEILDSCLDFFRRKLLIWILNMGGWISSISALTQFSAEHITASSFGSILSGEVVVAFACGMMMGGIIVWKLKKSS